MSEGGAGAPPSLEEMRRGQNPDGSVRDKSLVEIKREMLLAYFTFSLFYPLLHQKTGCISGRFGLKRAA